MFFTVGYRRIGTSVPAYLLLAYQRIRGFAFMRYNNKSTIDIDNDIDIGPPVTFLPIFLHIGLVFILQ